MVLLQVGYRARQFWGALWAKPNPEQLKSARQRLTPDQYALFQQLQPSEMSHALRMCEDLTAQGYDDPDLLAAALLHDIGKVKHPLRIWERVLIVLGQKVFPHQVARWGMGEPRGWRRAFAIAAQHPAWGAEMVAEIGASPLVLEIIRCHQDTAPEYFEEEERILFARLQAVDNNQ
jgi:putative nucleotidyltransferase with HDIG domain